MRVTVVRIYDEYFIEEVPIPFETRWEANPSWRSTRSALPIGVKRARCVSRCVYTMRMVSR